MQLFEHLEYILQIKKPETKCKEFTLFYEKYLHGEFSFNHEHTSLKFKEPSYIEHCEAFSNTVNSKRKKLGSDKGKAMFLHAIAHIEYSAIDLAIDAAYRFKNMPKAFYDDWLEVAMDEVRHFELLEILLERVGSFYGEYPVHYGLFNASMQTLGLLERMAVIPRYFEAGGLDATPIMIEKLQGLVNDDKAEEIIKVLALILEEEGPHVLKGDKWFKYACDELSLEYEVYFEIIEKFYPGAFPRNKELNIQARKDAGFSCSELQRINTDVEC